MKGLAAAALLVLMLCLVLPTVRGVDLGATITGPDGLAPGTHTNYTVTVQGTQGLGNATYRASYWVTADNTSGASPLQASPGAATSFNSTLRLSIAAPAREENMDVNVKVTVNAPSGNFTTTATKTVVVAKPWVIRFPIENSGPVAVQGALVSFYLDGRFIGNTTTAIPGGTALGPGHTNATLTWVPINVGAGGHELKVSVDLNADGKIEPELGDYVTMQTIYRGSGAVNPAYVAIATILTTVLFASTIFYIRRRRRSKR